MESPIIESLRDDLTVLYEAGAISKVTMHECDAICPPPVREFSADKGLPSSNADTTETR